MRIGDLRNAHRIAHSFTPSASCCRSAKLASSGKESVQSTWTTECVSPATAMLFAVSFLVVSLATAVEGQTEDPARVLTETIEFAGGRLVNGAPPRPTYMPGDPKIEREPPLTVSPGDRDSLSVTISSLEPSSTLELYLRFGTSTASHIRIQAAAGSRTRETLELAFDVPADICDNLERVKHQTKLYELVNVGGTRISEEQERSVVLNCEDREPH